MHKLHSGKYKLKGLNHNKILRDNDSVILFSDYGNWVVVKPEQYESILNNTIDEKLYLFLEKNQIIVTEKNKESIILKYRKSKQHLSKGTSLHIMVTTLRCNLKCSYCHSGVYPVSCKDNDMSQSTAKKVVDFIFQSPSKSLSIVFQGGEPLLNYDTVQYVIEYANKKNQVKKRDLKFILVSNLINLNEKIAKYLIKNNVLINTTLDGPKELHDKNRYYLPGKGSYDQVVKSIKLVKNINKNAKINALMVTTKHSLSCYKEIVDEYNKIGLNKLFIRQLNNYGFASDNWDKLTYNSEEYLKFWDNVLDYLYTKDNMSETFSYYLAWKLLSDKPLMYMDLMSPCGAAIGQLSYNYDGNVFSCEQGRMLNNTAFKIGNVNKNNYNDVLTSKKTCKIVESSINDIPSCNQCSFQFYCGLCPVSNYKTTSNKFLSFSSEDRCKILKHQFSYVLNKLITDKLFYKKMHELNPDFKNPSELVYKEYFF